MRLGAVDPGRRDAATTVINRAHDPEQGPEAGLVDIDTFLPDMAERYFPGL